MTKDTERIKVLCKQYLIEADDDISLAYRLMQLEYSLINEPVPVNDFEDFCKRLEG